MRQNPYFIGLLLSLADRPHRNYCLHERDGRMPPQLLGSKVVIAHPAVVLLQSTLDGDRQVKVCPAVHSGWRSSG
jgi:hypothetical protein